jgi:hypothetical protein
MVFAFFFHLRRAKGGMPPVRRPMPRRARRTAASKPRKEQYR